MHVAALCMCQLKRCKVSVVVHVDRIDVSMAAHAGTEPRKLLNRFRVRRPDRSTHAASVHLVSVCGNQLVDASLYLFLINESQQRQKQNSATQNKSRHRSTKIESAPQTNEGNQSGSCRSDHSTT